MATFVKDYVVVDCLTSMGYDEPTLIQKKQLVQRLPTTLQNQETSSSSSFYGNDNFKVKRSVNDNYFGSNASIETTNIEEAIGNPRPRLSSVTDLNPQVFISRQFDTLERTAKKALDHDKEIGDNSSPKHKMHLAALKTIKCQRYFIVLMVLIVTILLYYKGIREFFPENSIINIPSWNDSSTTVLPIETTTLINNTITTAHSTDPANGTYTTTGPIVSSTTEIINTTMDSSTVNVASSSTVTNVPVTVNTTSETSTEAVTTVKTTLSTTTEPTTIESKETTLSTTTIEPTHKETVATTTQTTESTTTQKETSTTESTTTQKEISTAETVTTSTTDATPVQSSTEPS